VFNDDNDNHNRFSDGTLSLEQLADGLQTWNLDDGCSYAIDTAVAPALHLSQTVMCSVFVVMCVFGFICLTVQAYLLVRCATVPCALLYFYLFMRPNGAGNLLLAMATSVTRSDHGYFIPSASDQLVLRSADYLRDMKVIELLADRHNLYRITGYGQRYLAPVFTVSNARITVATPRPGLQLPERTLLEFTMLLHAQGWEENGGALALKQKPPVTLSGPKKWYHKNGNVGWNYCLALLKSEELCRSGLGKLYHGQLDAYYHALCSVSADMLSKVLPNQPAKYYKHLLHGGHKTETHQEGAKVEDDIGH
jgi:hypothetical protein